VVITGVLGAARARPLVETVCRFAREVHFVVPQQPRACTHAELEALMPAGYAGRCMRSEVARLFPAAGGCTAGGPEDVLVVTGSIYLLGEVMACLEPQRGNGAGRLQDF
jgi:dihydrofolate synthase/folylpolyglutamate synthase